MAMQILPRTPGFADSFGTGLGAGLAQLAQDRYGQLQQGKIARQLEAMGVPMSDAQYIAGLPAKFQLQALGMLNPGEEQQLPFQGMLEQLSPQQAQEPVLQSLGNLKALQGLPISELLSQLQGVPGQQNAPVIQQPQFAQPVAQQQVPQVQQLAPAKVSKSPVRSSLIGGLDKQAKAKQQQLERKEQMARQKEIDKETLPEYEKLVANKEVADISDKRLNKMEALIKKGNLTYSGLYRFLKGLEGLSPSGGATAGASTGGLIGLKVGGLPGAALGTAIGTAIGSIAAPISSVLQSGQNWAFSDTEQFEKLSTDFIRDAKNVFGSRITDADLKTFLQMIPTLAQTDHGKLAIINNMKMFNEASQIKYKNMKKIIHENGGRRPDNFAILIEEKSKPELDKLAKKFETV